SHSTVEVTHTSNNFFDNPISGLLGLGFVTLLQTSKTPFWEAIIFVNETASPEFSIWLARGSGQVPQDPSVLGGIFTFGGTHASLYSGDIKFLGSVPGYTGSWSLYISSITIEGQFISFAKEGMLAGFDINTEGIIGPASVVQTIWAAVPGANELSESPGFYQFSCNATFNLTVSFSGRAWPINSTSMNLGPTGNTSQCLGAISASSDFLAPGGQWTFGVAFMENVYCVFRQNPLSMGFAELSILANGTGEVPLLLSLFMAHLSSD
ncbi:aspartic peptidase domain-containing protein, partial [Mycena galopus ATCC 62051]